MAQESPLARVTHLGESNLGIFRGVQSLRKLLGELDPKWPSRSTLEVKTRRLLMAHGMTNFVREHPPPWSNAGPGQADKLTTCAWEW